MTTTQDESEEPICILAVYECFDPEDGEPALEVRLQFQPELLATRAARAVEALVMVRMSVDHAIERLRHLARGHHAD